MSPLFEILDLKTEVSQKALRKKKKESDAVVFFI